MAVVQEDFAFPIRFENWDVMAPGSALLPDADAFVVRDVALEQYLQQLWWNLPWGQVASAAATTGTAGLTAEADVLTVTFTAIANRIYRLDSQFLVTASIANDHVLCRLTDNSNVELQRWDHFAVINADVEGGSMFVTFDGVAAAILPAGSTTLKLRASRASGTGSDTISATATRPTILTVSDCGAAGNHP